jgi:DNA-binding transcriptional LysR family regulator
MVATNLELSKVRLFDLQVFVILAREKSFSKTGSKLKMTQSSVTQVIHKLEEDLGTKLISRSSRSFTLTSTGRILSEAAVAILDRFQVCRQNIEKVDSADRDRLRIAVSTTPGEFILPPFFSQFATGVTGIHLAIEMCDSKKALEMLVNKEVQVAIVGSIMEHLGPDFEVELLLDEPLVLVISNNVDVGINEAGEHVLGTDVLAGLTRVDREAGSGTQAEASGFLERIEAKIRETYPDHVPKTMQLQSTQSIMAAIAGSHDLFAMIGENPAKQYASLGQIKIVQVEGLNVHESRAISIVYNKHEMTDALKLFLVSIHRYFEMQDLVEKSM